MEYAVKLLAEDKPVTKIAHALNYESIHSFSKAFKGFYGISPKQYKFKLNSV